MAPPGPVYTREDEYETQLYGFCQKDILEHLKSCMLEEFSKTASAFKSSLLDMQKTDEGKATVERVAKTLLDKCSEASQAPLERLREDLQVFFGLPPHVLLHEDRLQRKQYTPEDELKERDEISKVISRFRRAQYLKNCYEEELKRAQLLEDRAAFLKKTLSQLENPVKLAEVNKSKEFHKMVQNLLGAEVEEASLKLSDQLPCAESSVALDHRIYDLDE